ncbi:MAG TPA: LptA/OstA family protein [Opitutaceae bacterium]|nr:LptA/OstA family protein [Opitutaceae bacterium]
MTPRCRAALACLLFAPLGASVRAAPSTPPETVIESQSLEMRSTDTETISVFTGNVTVTGNDIRITCDRLDVVSLRKGDRQDTVGKQDRFKSLVATGKVHIVQGDREATCERAEVLPGADTITLTGRPMVVDRGNNSTATGEPLILYRGQRRVDGTNVRLTLPPLKDLGFDKKQPPPAPPSAPAPQS